jgi:hypothetical protein
MHDKSGIFSTSEKAIERRSEATVPMVSIFAEKVYSSSGRIKAIVNFFKRSKLLKRKTTWTRR